MTDQQERIATLLHMLVAQFSREELNGLIDAEEQVLIANMHYGNSAIVAANNISINKCRDVARKLRDYDQERILNAAERATGSGAEWAIGQKP